MGEYGILRVFPSLVMFLQDLLRIRRATCERHALVYLRPP